MVGNWINNVVMLNFTFECNLTYLGCDVVMWFAAGMTSSDLTANENAAVVGRFLLYMLTYVMHDDICKHYYYFVLMLKCT